MSTRSNIGIINEDGSVDVIYCHYDGYPAYNGAVLQMHYRNPDKVRELIALGDISILAPELKPAQGEHSFDAPQADVVIAYGRDRNEAETEATHFDSMKAYRHHMKEGSWIEYIYLFDLTEAKWLWAPCHYELGIGEFQELAKLGFAA